ncbi:MAG: hypothetical protein P1U86_06390 [Verrucomicrobiales bacterium]|nr:hypothetical protein [Verrucomicrobiales bacterium]
MSKSVFDFYNSSIDLEALIRRFSDLAIGADPDYFTNFLGVKVPAAVYPPVLEGREGQVEAPPLPANWHACVAEWGAVIRSVMLSGDAFRMVELGCGWGCWLNNGLKLAEISGKSGAAIGIEGDLGYVEMARQILDLNGFDKGEASVLHGVAGPTGKRAFFPIREGAEYGLEPIFVDESSAEEERIGGMLVEVDVYGLDKLFGEGEKINLLHIDIQGGEVEFLRDNLESLNAVVEYLVIGTHSRLIEGELIALLSTNGWKLEIERPAVFEISGDEFTTSIDGLQGWIRNK